MATSIAILGATSWLARDLVARLAARPGLRLALYARRPAALAAMAGTASGGASIGVHDLAAFPAQPHDAVINFIGAGDPARVAQMGASIIETTLAFDGLVLDHLRRRPDCRYIFASSGAVYGGDFIEPVDAATQARLPINALGPGQFYGAAKMMAELRHRALADLPIVDIRVFGYFSRTIPRDSRLFLAELSRALLSGERFVTAEAAMERDYLHPADFAGLIDAILASPPRNVAVDAHSRAPVEKFALLDACTTAFGLQVERRAGPAGLDATGAKPRYFSLDRRAGTLFGYQPAHGSLDGVLGEMRALLAASPAG